MKPLVDYVVEHDIPIGAICGATFFIGEEGYVEHKKHTSNTLEFLKKQSPHYKGDAYYVDKQAVRDENMVTANVTGTLEFTKEVLKLLNAKPVEKIEEWYTFQKKGLCQE